MCIRDRLYSNLQEVWSRPSCAPKQTLIRSLEIYQVRHQTSRSLFLGWNSSTRRYRRQVPGRRREGEGRHCHSLQGRSWPHRLLNCALLHEALRVPAPSLYRLDKNSSTRINFGTPAKLSVFYGCANDGHRWRSKAPRANGPSLL